MFARVGSSTIGTGMGAAMRTSSCTTGGGANGTTGITAGSATADISARGSGADGSGVAMRATSRVLGAGVAMLVDAATSRALGLSCGGSATGCLGSE